MPHRGSAWRHPPPPPLRRGPAPARPGRERPALRRRSIPATRCPRSSCAASASPTSPAGIVAGRGPSAARRQPRRPRSATSPPGRGSTSTRPPSTACWSGCSATPAGAPRPCCAPAPPACSRWRPGPGSPGCRSTTSIRCWRAGRPRRWRGSLRPARPRPPAGACSGPAGAPRPCCVPAPPAVPDGDRALRLARSTTSTGRRAAEDLEPFRLLEQTLRNNAIERHAPQAG